jgi:site-specific recombinase XerD
VVGEFTAWCQQIVTGVQPLHVAAWIELQTWTLWAATINQHLAAMRHPFDWLAISQLMPRDPAALVGRPSHTARRRKNDRAQRDGSINRAGALGGEVV